MSFIKTKKFQAIALTLGQGMSSLINLAVGMVMARLLEKQDVAAYQQTLIAFTTVAPLLGLGIGNGIYYFLPIEEERPRGRVFDALTALGVSGLLFALFIALGGNELLANRFDNPQVAKMLLWMIPFSIFTIPASIHSSVLVSQGKAGLSSIVTTVFGLIIGLGTIIPLFLWQSEETALKGRVIASCLIALASVILMIKVTPRGEEQKISWKEIKSLIAFSFPLGLAVMIGTINQELDKIIVASMCSPEEFAVYAFGAKELPLLGIITGSITAVMLPDMRKAVKSGNLKLAASKFKSCVDKTSLLIIPIIAVVFIGSEQIVLLMYGNQYVEAAEPMRVYAIALVARVAVFGALMTALGMNKQILFRTFLGISFNILLTIPMVKYFGSIGAAYSTVLVILGIALPYSIIVISRNTQIQIKHFFPIKKIVVRCLLVCVIIVICEIVVK